MINYGLAGRVVCVTGGASGIGRATALALAADGAHVGIIDVQADKTAETLAELRALGARAAGAVADVRDAEATKQAADKFEAELGPVVGLFASAGTSTAMPAEALSEEDFTRVLDINLKGVFLSCREFGGRMIGHGKGAIVLVSSIDGLGGHPGRAHYTSSKHALIGLTRNLALEWGRHGVRVNAIAPGSVDTPLLRKTMPMKFINEVVCDRTPLGRMADASELASVALMLLSDACSYVSGVSIAVDGGLTAGFFTHRQGGDYSSNPLLQAGIYSE